VCLVDGRSPERGAGDGEVEVLARTGLVGEVIVPPLVGVVTKPASVIRRRSSRRLSRADRVMRLSIVCDRASKQSNPVLSCAKTPALAVTCSFVVMFRLLVGIR
jgi:hypothetical protein